MSSRSIEDSTNKSRANHAIKATILAAYPERTVSTLHEQSCFLAAARMVGRWPLVVAEMINQHRQGHPEINAFDLIKREMSE
jgi:hypothetical protein